MVIEIREYKEKDKKEVIKLVKKVLFEIFNKKARNIQDLENIKEEYFGKQGVFYIAEDKGKIIGTIAVKKEKQGVARLKRMYVDEKYRKREIAQKLLNKILKFCKSKKYKKIILTTNPKMKAAIQFYEKRGLREYKRGKERIFFEKVV